VIEIAALCGFAFIAGLIDAVAGGGGLIQVPALFAVFPSAPPPLLLGTNKFSALAGTTLATVRYRMSVPIPWRALLPAAAVVGVGALVGAKTVSLVDPTILRPMLVILLVVIAAYVLLRPNFGEGAAQPKKLGGLFFVTVAIFGFYDGFFGPGAGSVLMFVLVRFFGHDFLRAAMTTKVLNWTSNFSALVIFAISGNVLYAAAIPMAVFNTAGGFIGAHLAVQRGRKFIRGMFLLVVSLLLAKLIGDELGPLWELFHVKP
jgi:uncharacterized membrane protein YfcA